jgi:hypothetical protein
MKTIPQGAIVRVETTNGGETIGTLAQEYVPSYHLFIAEQPRRAEFAIEPGRIKSVEQVDSMIRTINLKDGAAYRRGDSTLVTIGGPTKDYPELVWSIGGDWYERTTGRYAYTKSNGGYELLSFHTWRDLTEECAP